MWGDVRSLCRIAFRVVVDGALLSSGCYHPLTNFFGKFFVTSGYDVREQQDRFFRRRGQWDAPGFEEPKYTEARVAQVAPCPGSTGAGDVTVDLAIIEAPPPFFESQNGL